MGEWEELYWDYLLFDMVTKDEEECEEEEECLNLKISIEKANKRENNDK